MNPETRARLQKAILFCDRAMLLVGVLMIAYVGIGVAGLVSSGARHYAAFMLFVLIMSGIAAFRTILGERLGLKVIDDGFAAETYAAARTQISIEVCAAA